MASVVEIGVTGHEVQLDGLLGDSREHRRHRRHAVGCCVVVVDASGPDQQLSWMRQERLDTIDVLATSRDAPHAGSTGGELNAITCQCRSSGRLVTWSLGDLNGDDLKRSTGAT
jgi:hypothetical protein